jgi:hypothetical protein
MGIFNDCSNNEIVNKLPTNKLNQIEIRKNNMFANKYYRILEEVERVSIEINALETKKLEILNLNN